MTKEYKLGEGDTLIYAGLCILFGLVVGVILMSGSNQFFDDYDHSVQIIKSKGEIWCSSMTENDVDNWKTYLIWIDEEGRDVFLNEVCKMYECRFYDNNNCEGDVPMRPSNYYIPTTTTLSLTKYTKEYCQEWCSDKCETQVINVRWTGTSCGCSCRSDTSLTVHWRVYNNTETIDTLPTCKQIKGGTFCGSEDEIFEVIEE